MRGAGGGGPASEVAARAAAGVAMLLAGALGTGCGNGCGRTGTGFGFNQDDYYLWAWRKSGGTLVVGGSVPVTEADARKQGAAEECPTADDAYRFVQDPTSLRGLPVECVSVERVEPRQGFGLGTCEYRCVYDYCFSDG